MSADGARLASRRLPEGLAGIRSLHEVLADHAGEPGEVVIGIETDRGLWVQAMGVAGYQVFAINPLAVARYRDRYHVSGAKSDASDAKVADPHYITVTVISRRGAQLWCAPEPSAHCMDHLHYPGKNAAYLPRSYYLVRQRLCAQRDVDVLQV